MPLLVFLAFAFILRLCLPLHSLHCLLGIQVTWSGFFFQTEVLLHSLRWWCDESVCMLSSNCELLSSTFCLQLARSASFSKEVDSTFPPRRVLGAIIACSSWVRYHSLSSIFQTHLRRTTAHCHWLLIVVNHESWRFSPDSQWSSQMLWNTWSQFRTICWSSQHD